MRRSRTSQPRAAVALAVAASAVLAGCWDRDAESPALTVARTSPALGDGAAPVLLNDALTVYFSDEISPLSVTPDSVTMLDEAGNRVPGTLKVGSNWVAFQPEPPLTETLDDGSFRPGGRYRLELAGHPRAHSIRARDGRWLASGVALDVDVADLGGAPPGLPSILRPPSSELPFLVGRPEVPPPVAADAPRLQVHFTLPVLPTGVRPEAFEVQLLGDPIETLVPRSARVVSTPVDDHPGSTVELDLGALPERADGTRRALRPDGWISVSVRPDGGLEDYAGRTPLPHAPLFWSVVPGRSLPLCEWPARALAYSDADGLAPGFEVQGTTIRPRVRVEAGSGALGAFRPKEDVVLRPGQPFDRGDGQLVQSDGGDFAFASIDVPDGVTVTVDAQDGPVHLRACGGVRIAGRLELRAAPTALPSGRFGTRVEELIDAAPVSICAAGDVVVHGEVVYDGAIGQDQTVLLMATAGWLRLGPELPFQTMLVVERRAGDARSRIEGPRGQSRVYPAAFTPGLAPGAAFEAVGLLPWKRLPAHRDRGVLQLGERTGRLVIAWQSTAPDAIRGDAPDTSPGRPSRWQIANDRDLLFAEAAGSGAGAFLRFRLSADVRAGQPLPSVNGLRVVEN